jgi:hypothetical protein
MTDQDTAGCCLWQGSEWKGLILHSQARVAVLLGLWYGLMDAGAPPDPHPSKQ